MIITLICIAAVILGIICLFIANDHFYRDCLLGIGVGLIMVGMLGSVACVGLIIDVNMNKDIKYQNALYEKEMLEYRIEHMEEDIVGNEMLYNDIVEFNNKLRSTKKWANNSWTNWFNNEDVASINYIEIGDN